MRGVSRAVGKGRATARASASHNGVSVRLMDAGSFITVSTSTWSARSPSAAARWARTSASPSPGSVRTSTPSSTRSGITFVFIWWPSTTLHENVVCVQACRCRAAPALGMAASTASMRSGSASAARSSGSRPMLSSWVPHSSCSRGAGRYSARRLITAAAFTSALSLRNGAEPWPGVPRRRRRRHATPFSATFMPTNGASAGPECSPPLSVST